MALNIIVKRWYILKDSSENYVKKISEITLIIPQMKCVLSSDRLVA